MSTFIIAIVVLAIIHFVYEGIVAPSIRMHLRNRLFTLRDEIRNLKIEGGISAGDETAFWFVHNGINHFLNRLPYLTVMRKVQLEAEYKTNKELREIVTERISVVRGCGNAEIVRIFDKTTFLIEEAFIVNMGGWFFYLVPIAVVAATISKLSTLASELIATPERDTNRLLPQT
jgi:hypothetical protein